MTKLHTAAEAQPLSLSNWAVLQLAERDWSLLGDAVLTPVSGDAGFRSYWRVNSEPSLLAVDAPPATENNRAFVDIARHLRSNGVHSPEIVAVDYQRGYLLVEDLGDGLYLPALKSDTDAGRATDSAEMLYGEALLTLLRMQQAPPLADVIAPYNQQALRAEMNLFSDWFVPQLLGYELNEGERSLLSEAFSLLEVSAAEQPQVLVHRDYHSRNLLWREGAAPGVVDFQDALWGPVTYDLVSLLKDCYIRWPRADVERWALAYGNMALDTGILPDLSAEQFLRWFDWMGLQRHIKVLGIFARLYLRDGKPGYLQDLPLVLRYSLEVLERYPEFAVLAEWFKSQLLPLIEQQSWYSDYRCAGEVFGAPSKQQVSP